jgi:hypothetical protein
MDIVKIQTLIAQGKVITDIADIDPTQVFIQVGVYQPNNRKIGSAVETYPSVVIALSDIITASNGLNIINNDIKLGGTLIQPTTITAGDIIPLTISDDKGIIFETRDANYNMRWNQINGGASIDSVSSAIFAYGSDGGTSFINSLIACHFGGACSYDTATDTWNFGDYSNFTNTNISFNLGRENAYNNTVGISVFGNDNIIDASYNVTVIGSNNTVIDNVDMFVLGNNDLNLIVDESGNVGNEKVMNSKAHFTGLLEFTDNADALSNNLIIGDFYRTGDLLKVVH